MTLTIDDSLFERIKSDPLGVIAELDNESGYIAQRNREWEEQDRDELLDLYAVCESMVEEGFLDLKSPPIKVELTGSVGDDCAALLKYVADVATECSHHALQLRMSRLRTTVRAGISSTFAYEFSQGDFERIQHLVNDLRQIISDSQHFEQKHQRRLLLRLERLQAELHKRVSDLDTLWGLIGDAGVAFGKFGVDAKPIVDRIKEITAITWRTQSRAEELPTDSPFPQLEDKTSTDE
ncbi:hypothetical protein [Paraburkholderia caribensis]|uniref:hypothetical protein n=1 Tax=Paraburkholderia caribensis TaxID=75105 RepID=UPI0007206789|nr:hypothetical protein [Paraburkholderia caribensis]ALP62794.1 hypothetical protein AN416_09440 [Paraburkholderia caribensis]AUT51973.1 hypothetical protein C2L66_08960 [Paraburkholderia caribensis]